MKPLILLPYKRVPGTLFDLQYARYYVSGGFHNYVWLSLNNKWRTVGFECNFYEIFDTCEQAKEALDAALIERGAIFIDEADADKYRLLI